MPRPIAPKTSHARWSLFAATTAMIVPVVALATSFNQRGFNTEAFFSLKLFAVVALLALLVGVLLDKRQRQHASPFVPNAFFQAEDIESWSESFETLLEGDAEEDEVTPSYELYEPGQLWGRLSFTAGYVSVVPAQADESSLSEAA